MTTEAGTSKGPWWIHAAAFLHRHLWLTRAMTVGVRAIILDGEGRVLLLRHTYRPGWSFPGGGVDRNETAEAAVIREVREEAGLECRGRPLLHGFYWNKRLKRDHVACYVVRDFAVAREVKPDWEIAQVAFFPLDALPPDATPSVHARLRELFHGAPPTSTW
jgi:ADP-ribose pyrophosphatase YjhB (NUDIX family)